MSRDLPPLNWLRAFEAAARHESFLKAGEELGVSAGAVSQKVKSLEQRLGVRLFERLPRGVRLTDTGAAYQSDLTPALERMAAATDRIAAVGTAAHIRMAALPALAEKWLTPRLAQFQDANPDVSVELSVAKDIRQLADMPFDLAIHYEHHAVPGFDAVPLFRDEMLPVCSPAFAAETPVATPADLLECRLLYDIQWTDDWPRWFGAAGLPVDGGKLESGFALYNMAVEAAVEGLGVVMGHRALVAREMELGRLFAPIGRAVPVPHRYAVMVPSARRARRATASFVDWLRGEMPGA